MIALVLTWIFIAVSVCVIVGALYRSDRRSAHVEAEVKRVATEVRAVSAEYREKRKTPAKMPLIRPITTKRG